MKCRLRKLHDNKSWLVEKHLTSLGKDSCDINVKYKQQIVDRKHAFISVDEENNNYTIRDNNSTHGTYLNDRRIQSSSVHLQNGDVIRLGHGGPRFEVILEDIKVESNGNMSNLPTIAMTSSYQYRNGYTKPDKPNIVPHPPVKQRPVSANPANGPFQSTTTKPTISGNWTNGHVNCTDISPKVSYNSYLDYEAPNTDEQLAYRVNYETECQKKESVIDTLREEIDYLRKCTGLTQMKTFTAGCHEKIAALHNQLQIKNEDIVNLRTENNNLRTENDGLRQENNDFRAETRVRSENDDLRGDICRQITEMKLLVTQRDHKVALLENELCRLNKEKSQMTVLLNTLQKEITSRDEQLRKAKEEIEKYKVELRNRKNELSSMATRLSKSTELKDTIKGLKQKEEESKTLKYRVKSLEDKIVSSELHIQDLHENITEGGTKLAERENAHNAKIIDLTYQIKTLDEKLRHKDSYVKDLTVKIKELKTSIVEIEAKNISDGTSEIEATENLSTILCEIEKRLIDNGRCCTSLNEEINKLEIFTVSDNLRWVKECFLSYLSQEYSWERDIEDALKLVTGDAERAATPPTILIHLLHEKIEKNFGEVKDLEDQIKNSEEEREKNIEELKNSMKDKYKQKAEKAIKEIRADEKKNFNSEMKRITDENEKRLNEALEFQKGDQQKHLKSIHVLTEEVLILQNERNKMKSELDELQTNLEKSSLVECDYKTKVGELEKQNKIVAKVMDDKVEKAINSKNEIEHKLRSMEDICKALKESNDLRQFEIDELKPYKEQIDDHVITIKSLESKIEALQRGKSGLQEKLEDLNRIIGESKGKDRKLIVEKENKELLEKEIEKLLIVNEQLKKTAEDVQKQCDGERVKAKTTREELETALANLSDMKGDLSDRDKQRIEYLEDKCTKQEKELLEQQMHLVKLSTLVDEQKRKLVDQDISLQQQSEMLVDRHIPWATPSSLTSTPCVPNDLKVVGELCISKKHEEIILEQTNMIQDLNRSLHAVDRLGSAKSMVSPKAIVRMSNTIEDLKDELVVQERHATMSDQELYDDVSRLQILLTACNEELSLEQLTHKNNINALEQCEELYLKFVRDTNRELDIPQILGAKPVSFISAEERAAILTERSKGLEIVVNRVRALKSRIERKDQLLEHYDDDLKSLRDTESLAGKKSFEVDALNKELTEFKNEIAYLQESLKKWRSECDELKRQNNSLKQNKVLMMDYNGAAGSVKARKAKPKSKAMPSFPYAEEVKQ